MEKMIFTTFSFLGFGSSMENWSSTISAGSINSRRRINHPRAINCRTCQLLNSSVINLINLLTELSFASQQTHCNGCELTIKTYLFDAKQAQAINYKFARVGNLAHLFNVVALDKIIT